MGYDPAGNAVPSPDSDACGFTPRLMQALLDAVSERNAAAERGEGMPCRLSITYVEIYNERVHDLLAPREVQGERGYDLVQDEHRNYVPKGVAEAEVRTMDDVIRVLT
jgi:hypothetical protein